MCAGLSKNYADLGVAFGPGYPLIRLQALATGPVSAAIPNATPNGAFCRIFNKDILSETKKHQINPS